MCHGSGTGVVMCVIGAMVLWDTMLHVPGTTTFAVVSCPTCS